MTMTAHEALKDAVGRCRMPGNFRLSSGEVGTYYWDVRSRAVPAASTSTRPVWTCTG